MAKTVAVWGIDIGQCALKALRCHASDEDGRITADAFDYIEYPKILSQPEADPAELVREALELFLSRNSVRDDRVAISVSGQSGLARFIKLPPVESKKIPDIVKYEARQQIPFALEDVVWDYQQMAGGSEEDGFALETEVGLFAMKRDQVYRALKPFDAAGIELDVIQLTPLAIYNYTVFDQMRDLPPPDQYDPDNPPESQVVLSLGTDTTDLVITNGYRVWQRSIPLGGSHFTKALTKELRLTFAKAEHLKRNAMQAEDTRAIFQAMRPVYNDLLTEIQRSIGYFTNIDKGAKIGRVIALGNATKLKGLQKYLSQNLGYPVSEVEAYRGLGGTAVTSAPIFKDNLLSFAVCYGLCLQGLGKAALSTNLLPREIVTDRLIRSKKPWVVGLVAAMLLGVAINFLGHWRAWNSVREDRFMDAFRQASNTVSESDQANTDFETAHRTYNNVHHMGQNIVNGTNIVGDEGNRIQWLPVLKAIDECLPQAAPGNDRKADDLAEAAAGQRGEIPFGKREEIHVDQLELEYSSDLAAWYHGVADKINAAKTGGKQPGKPAPTIPPPGRGMLLGTPTEGPTGEGWIIQIRGHHFHNDEDVRGEGMVGAEYVRHTFMKNLTEREVGLPAGKGQEPVNKPIKEIGLAYPVLVEVDQVRDVSIEVEGEGDGKPIKVREFKFTFQCCWQKKAVKAAKLNPGY
jgi:type IV pilus assembly protein PilM